MKNTHRLLIVIAFLATACSCNREKGEIPGLKDVYRDAFKIGTSVNSFEVSGKDPQAIDLILKHFNTLTPDNEAFYRVAAIPKSARHE